MSPFPTDTNFAAVEVFTQMLADLEEMRAPRHPGEEQHPVSMLVTGAAFVQFHRTVANGSMDAVHDLSLLVEDPSFGTPTMLLECLIEGARDGETPDTEVEDLQRFQLRKMMEVYDRVAPVRLEAAVRFALPHAQQSDRDEFLHGFHKAHEALGRDANLEQWGRFSSRADELVDVICSADRHAAVGL